MLKITIEGLENDKMVLEGKGIVFAIIDDQCIETRIRGAFNLEELFNIMLRINETLIEASKRFEKKTD